MPALPAPRPPVELSVTDLVLGVACPDRSGRVSARALLHALHWSPGHRIGIRAHAGMLVLASAPSGRHVVGSRAELPLPAAARRMCGILARQQVLLTACPAHDLLVIHPARTVGQLLADLHARALEVDRVG